MNVAMLVCCMPVLAPVVGKARDAILSIATCGSSKWALLSADHTQGNTIELSPWPDRSECSEHLSVATMNAGKDEAGWWVGQDLV